MIGFRQVHKDVGVCAQARVDTHVFVEDRGMLCFSLNHSSP